MKVEIQKNLQCFNEIQAGSTSKRKTWGAETPHAPRFSRNASDYDLHEKAGGLPLQTITAPNIRRLSKQGREVCKQERKLTSLLKNVGPKGHTTHQAGK